MDPQEQPATKIPDELENPIDVVLLRVCEAIEPTLMAAGATPNIVTMASALAGAGSAWALWHGKLGAFIVLYFLAYFGDVLDGHMARRYGMVTQLGDVLDHTNDTLRFVVLVTVLLLRHRMPLWGWAVMAATLLLMASQLGCQQKAYAPTRPADRPAETLDGLIPLCPARDGNVGMKTTRWFGVGTWQVVFVLLVVLAVRKASV